MNYRKLYSINTGIPVPSSFDVHHIDGNRKNNNIFNLVALPRKLHHQLHFLALPEGFNVIPDTLSENITGSYNFLQMKNYLKVYEECCKWVDYRNFLLKEVPNFHGLSY